MKFDITNHDEEVFQRGQVRLTIESTHADIFLIIEAAKQVYQSRMDAERDALLRSILET